MDSVYGDKTLKKTPIYAILKKVKYGKNTVDQRHPNPKKRTCIPDVIASVAATVEEDRWVTINSIALANEVSVKTVLAILHKDLGLLKKSAKWVPRLLNSDLKQERVLTCQQFLAAVEGRFMA